MDGLERSVVRKINRHRAAAGLRPMQMSAALARAADYHTREMLVGNYFDTRRLTSFSGELRLDIGGDDNPYYAFEGLIDELRISNGARTDFTEPASH